MSISQFFNKLGAPLHNMRWSWGSERVSDGAIFLRVWQDREKKRVIEDVIHCRLTDYAHYQHDPTNLGWLERLKHIERIRDGAQSFLIMCRVKVPGVRPRVIESFNKDDVFVGGQLCEIENDVWIKIEKRIPYRESMAG